MATPKIVASKDMDLSKFSPKQLKDLIEQANQKFNESIVDRCKALKEKFQKMCDDEGVTLNQVWFDGKQGGGGGPGSVKYKNPETGQTWTGRGKKPHWLYGHEEEFSVG